jgi:hypothetical protein
MNFVHRCMIVPTEHVELARKLCETLAGPGGAGMFTTPLSTTGIDPATHYISSGMIESDFAELLPLIEFPADADPVIHPGQPDLITQMATDQGMGVTVDEVQALLASVDVSEQAPAEALDMLGLEIVIENSTL